LYFDDFIGIGIGIVKRGHNMTSAKYMIYLQEKAKMEKELAGINNQVKEKEQEIEAHRLEYSKTCNHPNKFRGSAVCVVCYGAIPSDQGNK
jgi:hypothetical protein